MAQLLIWGRAKTGDFAPGDIVEVLPDGVHAGTKILNEGQAWDGTVRSDSEFIILDFSPGTTVRQAIRDFVQRVTGNAVPDLTTLNRFVSVDWQAIPTPVRNALISTRRRSIDIGDLRSYLTLRDGVTLQDVKDAYNRNVPPDQRI
jgi:hypothetical protein